MAGICFIVPAMVITLGFAWAYVEYGSTPEVTWLLYGVTPVIIGVVVQALSVITATMSWGSGQAPVRDVTLSILWAPTGNTHPSSVRSAFE